MTSPFTAVGSTRTNAVTGMYYDFSIPLGLANLIEEVIVAHPGAPNQPIVSGGSATNRQWFSQPRPGNDGTTEVLTAIFKQPLSLSQLSFMALRVSCRIEAWYQDPQNNWCQMLNTARMPVSVTLSTSTQGSWYTYRSQIYPIIAKGVQLRFTRIYDPTVGTAPYVVGVQNLLLRRDVYDRANGKMPLVDTQDTLGNVISAYIKDWNAAKAIDDNPNTFWRSAPQPDPAAVVNLYLDLRTMDGDPQLVDAFYLDPVYVNQTLNLYYSNDDTVGSLKLSPQSLAPDFEDDTRWTSGVGLIDTSDFGGTCSYQFPLALGPMVSQNLWIGIEWTPDFAAVATNAVQTVAVSPANATGTFTLTYASEVTDPIARLATAAQVQSALEALPAIGAGNVRVQGGAGGTWVVTFQNSLGGLELATMGAAASLSSGGTVTVDTVSAGGQGGAPPQNPVLFGVTPGVDAVQSVTIVGDATGGTFALDFEGEITAALAHDASSADMVAALEALPGIGVGDVLVVGDDGGPWTVTFRGALGQQPIPVMSGISALTGTDPAPTVKVGIVTTGTAHPPSEDQYWPKIFYDAGAGEITLELTNGTATQTYSVPLSPPFQQYRTLRIVVGWSYAASGVIDEDTVTMSVTTRDGTVVGSLTATPDDLPALITLDGEAGFTDFRGTFSAHIIKMEDVAAGQTAFQANPTVYTFPAPVIPNPDGTIPSTTLDNAIYASAWTLQQYGTGGTHESIYETKTWTPVWVNYVTQKGRLFLPQAIRMKYLKCEFSNLTEEPYPVYDTGITTSYLVFPMTVTAQATLQARANPGLLGIVSGLLNVGAGVLQGIGSGSVNWLNPSTVQRALSTAFTPVTQTVTVTAGQGFVTGSLPGTAQTSITTSTRTEAGSPWVYRRPMMDAGTLANHAINEINRTTVVQNVSSVLDPVSGALSASFPTGPLGTATAIPPSLPIQGQDWWVFPGGTLKMAAAVMNGITAATQVVTARKRTLETRYRFTTTSIHRYDTRTVTVDAGLAYFAGVREIQALATTYIANQDPVSFIFSSYDPSQWVFDNIRTLDTGPISTAGKIFSMDNADFDLGLGDWTVASGDWSWDGSQFSGYMYPGAAKATANGTQAVLVSPHIVAVGASQDLTPGDVIDFTAAVRWEDLVVDTGQQALQMAVVELSGDTVVRTTVISDSSMAPPMLIRAGIPMTMNEVTAALGGRGVLTATAVITQYRLPATVGGHGQLTTIRSWRAGSGAWNVPIYTAGHGALSAVAKPQFGVADAAAGRGRLTVSAVAKQFKMGTTLSGKGALTTGGTPTSSSSSQNDYVTMSGTWTVPDGVDGAQVAFIVSSHATSGTAWFDFLRMNSGDTVDATIYKDFITTSTFTKVTAALSDSGSVRSDSMWAQLDPADTNISSSALAYYTTTIPDSIPSGTWGDTFATWGDAATAWGERRQLVAIDVDPNRTYQGQRVLHFRRAVGGEEAGVKVRQWTNFISNGLARINATWLKPLANDNQITLRLRRMFDGVYIYEQSLAPAVGYWQQASSNWFEIPDSSNQVYTVELVLSGDDVDELYLSDLWCEVAHVRYFIQLGGASAFLHDVTPLAYSSQAAAIVSTTAPVNEMVVQARILSPKVWVYSCQLTPSYLR